VEVARLLVDAGADVAIQDSIGLTSLHYAAMYNYISMAEYLIVEVRILCTTALLGHDHACMWASPDRVQISTCVGG
jgi:ankyrin repeat protein